MFNNNGVVNGAYFNHTKRVPELNERTSSRNVPSNNFNMSFSFRPVSMRYTTMPVIDPKNEASVSIEKRSVFNQNTMFSPGNGVNGPWDGYTTNIDTESKMRNQFFSTQSCAQSKFIPSSDSDLYNVNVNDGKEYNQPHDDLFSNKPFSIFNPNILNVGNDLFNNNTRVQRTNTK